ncbi:Degenerin-like protein T28D9.7 [Dirofilaria immitis]|nr:Degenerin-like protein T28D9.7 [Dirofilaria immitis]
MSSIQAKRAKNDSLSNEANLTVFDKVLKNAWDMDAVKFLRNAAHWKSRMILSCTWPNGTSCRLSNFKAIWTLTGLCWAINTDPNNPHYISSSGSDNGLRLLLNIEQYERIESCTPYFRTTSLPGLKILIYNQTDVPESSLYGVNVPPGYTMEIPFKMQKRHKYLGTGCVEKVKIIVQQYHFNRIGCPSPCDQIDYTAWQDMTLLPNSIFPSLIDTTEEEDVEDVIDDYDTEIDTNITELHRDEHFQCEQNQLLSNQQVSSVLSAKVRQIKRAAQRAYEKQSRYQEDIRLRTKRMILKLREATQKLIDNGWGWKDETYQNAFERLNKSIDCFNALPINHAKTFAAIENPSSSTEEARIALIYRAYFFSFWNQKDINGAKRFHTVVQLRETFGDRFDEDWYNPMLKDLDENLVRNIIDMADDELPNLLAAVENGRGLQMGSMLYFGDTTMQHTKQFSAFIHDIVDCTFGDVKMKSAYSNLYQKELPAYLANFDFGSAFVEKNFAMVNVFLHQMTIETWRQESTYSIWSLACDVGGALGLFLGASLLTVIELIYSCFQYGLCNPFCFWPMKCWKSIKTHPTDKTEKWKKKDKLVEAETKLIGVTVKDSKIPISCSTSAKNSLMNEKMNDISEEFNNQNYQIIEQQTSITDQSNNALLKHPILNDSSSSISLINSNNNNKDNILTNDLSFKKTNLEEYDSIRSFQGLENIPGQFSFESGSSEWSDKMARLFQPKMNDKRLFKFKSNLKRLLIKIF